MYLRYIDEALIFKPESIKILNIAGRLSKVEPTRDFTYKISIIL